MNPHKNSKALWGCAGLRLNKMLKHAQLINAFILENQIPRHIYIQKSQNLFQQNIFRIIYVRSMQMKMIYFFVLLKNG